MTPEQIQASSDLKAKQINDLCRTLKMTIMPREIVTKEGFIERIVYFFDNEQYPQKNDKPTDIQPEKAAA